MIRRRKGSITIFLAIVIPVIIISGFHLFDYLNLRHNESKAMKVTLMSSEAKLGNYNKYLSDHYYIHAAYEDIDLAEYTTYYLNANNIASKSDIKVNADYDRLSDPNNFRKAVIGAAPNVVINDVYDWFAGMVNASWLGDKIQSVSDKLEDLEEKMGDLMKIPKAFNNIRTGMMPKEVGDKIRSLEDKLSRDSREMAGFLVDANSQLDQLKEDGELYDLKKESVESLDVEHRKQTKEISDFLEILKPVQQEAEKVQDELEKKEDEIKSISQEISALKSYKSGPVDGEHKEIIDGQIAELESQKSSLEEEAQPIRENLDELKQQMYSVIENKPELPERDRGINLMKKFSAGAKKIAKALKLGGSNGEKLKLPQGVDYRKEGLEGKSGFKDKFLIVEWCCAVFGSYDKKCPRKFGRSTGKKPGESKKPSGLAKVAVRKVGERMIQGEVEYLISGDRSESKSMNEVRLKVIALRFPTNIIAIARNNEIKRSIEGLTSPIPPPFNFVVKAIAYTALVTAESNLDFNLLLEGHGLDIFKKPDDWKIKISTLLTGDAKSLIGKSKKSGSVLDSKLYYLDYLRLLLYMQSEKNTITRSMNIIAADLEKRQKGLRLDKFHTGHTIDVEWENRSIVRHRSSKLRIVNNYYIGMRKYDR